MGIRDFPIIICAGITHAIWDGIQAAVRSHPFAAEVHAHVVEWICAAQVDLTRQWKAECARQAATPGRSGLDMKKRIDTAGSVVYYIS